MASTYLCVGFEAYVREVDESSTAKFTQFLTLYVKSTLNTQVTYDLANYVSGSLGTFWTAAIADTTVLTAPNPALGIAPPVVSNTATSITAGSVATQALAAYAAIAGVLAENPMSIVGPSIAVLQQVPSAPSSNQYSIALANNGYNLTFGTAGAPTTTTPIYLSWDLSPGNHGIKSPISYF